MQAPMKQEDAPETLVVSGGQVVQLPSPPVEYFPAAQGAQVELALLG